MFQLKHSESYKERLEIGWLYDKTVNHQKNKIKQMSLWNQWAVWFILVPMKEKLQDIDKIETRKEIMTFIGIEGSLFYAWYDMRRRTDPLPDDIDFFDVVFEFFFDKHYDLFYKNRNIGKNEKKYLLKIGLHPKAIKECYKNTNLASEYIEYKIFMKALSFVYDKMKKYEELDKKIIESK